MANQERFYKQQTADHQTDPANTFLKLDSIDFKRPMKMSVESFGKILNLELDADLDAKNVSALKFDGQDDNPAKPPSEIQLSDNVVIAVDENYLYIWAPQLGKWKRILLSDWSSSELPEDT